MPDAIPSQKEHAGCKSDNKQNLDFGALQLIMKFHRMVNIIFKKVLMVATKTA